MDEYDAIGTCVEIHGIQAGNLGRSCECHDVCGSMLHMDALIRIRWTVVQDGTLSSMLQIHGPFIVCPFIHSLTH